MSEYLQQNNLKNFNHKNQYVFDFQLENVYVSKEKQWLKNFNKNKFTDLNGYYENTKTKPSTPQVQIKRDKQLYIHEPQNSLAKTVKHNNLSNKKTNWQGNSHLINSQQVRYSQNLNKNYYDKSKQQKVKSQQRNGEQLRIKTDVNKNAIMSIEQIREMEKDCLNEKIIHKITSSTSRRKLRTSSSKDSKNSAKVQNNLSKLENKQIKLNPNAQRYNKYLQNQLINVSIDLRKQFAANQINSNSLKFNQRAIQPTNCKQQRISVKQQTSPLFHTDNQQKHICLSQRIQHDDRRSQNTKTQNNFLTQRDIIHTPLHEKLKNRSRSNLSKYSQHPQPNPQPKQINLQNQCLMICDQKRDWKQKRNQQVFSQNSPEHIIVKEYKFQGNSHYQSQQEKNSSKQQVDNKQQKKHNQQDKLQKNIHSLCFPSNKMKIQKNSILLSNCPSNNQMRKGQINYGLSLNQNYNCKRLSLADSQKKMLQKQQRINSLGYSQKKYQKIGNIEEIQKWQQFSSEDPKLKQMKQMKYVQNYIGLNSFQHSQQSSSFGQMIEQKIKKRPIRLTLQKKS